MADIISVSNISEYVQTVCNLNSTVRKYTLSVLGITESFLFCDSIDTTCKGIVDSFKKRYCKG